MADLPVQRAQQALPGARWTAVAAFVLTLLVLLGVVMGVERSLLLLGRFVPGRWGSAVQAVALATYAAWLAPKLLDPRSSALWRRRVWLLFSAVFFAQLGLALMGWERFQMTPGRLHLPVPALILAGPLYRQEGFFMLVLFVSSVLLAGPAWCSHLCYIGAWDNAMAMRRRKPAPLPRWRQPVRVALTAAVLAVAYLLAWLGGAPTYAGAFALAFGLVGVALMLTLSRRRGQMVHCVMYCPVGLAATWLGKMSLFRLRIAPSCTDCNACTGACRYDALRPEDIAARRPNSACTLCGDCLRVCRPQSLHYRFAGLTHGVARPLFVVIVVSLHAACLGLARV